MEMTFFLVMEGGEVLIGPFGSPGEAVEWAESAEAPPVEREWGEDGELMGPKVLGPVLGTSNWDS